MEILLAIVAAHFFKGNCFLKAGLEVSATRFSRIKSGQVGLRIVLTIRFASCDRFFERKGRPVIFTKSGKQLTNILKSQKRGVCAVVVCRWPSGLRLTASRGSAPTWSRVRVGRGTQTKPQMQRPGHTGRKALAKKNILKSQKIKTKHHFHLLSRLLSCSSHLSQSTKQFRRIEKIMGATKQLSKIRKKEN